MPNNLTDTEIKKALECCSTYHDVSDCKNCPLDGKCEPNLLEQYALDLINRQEEEKQSLKAEVERLRTENKLLIDNDVRNKYPNCVLVEKGRIYTKTLEDYDNLIGDISAEAYKEFAERLKEKLEHFPLEKENFVSEENIDNLLNELVGEDNESKA